MVFFLLIFFFLFGVVIVSFETGSHIAQIGWNLAEAAGLEL